jgi:hypothetical protein
MNRSILIVICDFLLVSLLAFSTVDVNKLSQPANPRTMSTNPTATPVSGKQDLGDVMRVALDEEKKRQDELIGELTRTRAMVSQQDAKIQSVRDQLESKEQLAARLAEEQSKLAEAHTNLQQQFAFAQTNLATLNVQLHASTVETVITKEERAAMEAEARKQSEKAASLEKQLAQLQTTNEWMQSDRQALQAQQQSLQTQLQLSAASNHYAVAQMSQLHDEVDAQRRENVRLTDGIKVLAAKSSELAREIHDTRPLTPNLIFDEMTTNRVLASFTGVRPGFLGADSTKDRRAQIILITDGTNIFALGHVQDTPLTLWSPGTQWEELRGTLEHGSESFPIQSLSFAFADPRVVLIPVPAAEARALGCKIYHLSKDPYVFQDAVVVGTGGDYYGECKFQIDVNTPQYLKMDHNSLEGLFGKFNPSSGDLVLSKTDELLGVMANNNYCAIIHDFEPEATFRFGPDGRNQPTAETLSTLYSVVTDLPFKLH